jgi:hypothetical protein
LRSTGLAARVAQREALDRDRHRGERGVDVVGKTARSRRRREPRHARRQAAELVLDLARHRDGEERAELRGIDEVRARHRLRERAPQLVRARVSRRGVAAQRLHQHGVERGRDPGADRARRDHGRVPDQIEQEELIGLGEEAPRREHLPEHDRERVHVGPTIDLAPARLLRRHVAELALERARRGPVDGVDLGDAEVDELHVALVREEHVVGAHVAMHHAERATLIVADLVGGVEARGDLHRDEDRELGRQATVLLRELVQELRERAAVHVLHHEEVLAVRRLAELLDVHDVRVRDA